MSWRRLAHALVVVVGLVILAYPLTLGAHPQVGCRGVTIGAGDTCDKADHSGTQTYESLLRTKQHARPVIAGLGALVLVFGATLLVADLRRAGPGDERRA